MKTKPNRKQPRLDSTLHVPWQKTPARRRREILLPEGIRPAAIARGRCWLDELIAEALAQQYTIATGEEATIRLNNALGYDERCSGTFADLLEECFDQSKKIWSASGFKSRLPAPIHKGGRLEYARKALQAKRVAALQK